MDEIIRGYLLPPKEEPDIGSNRLEQARKEHMPFVQMAFKVVGFHYAQYWLPNSRLIPIPKKKEDTEIRPTTERYHSTPYIYLVNFVPPRELWPNPRDAGKAGFAQPGRLTDSDWNPNVAMQYSVHLANRFDFKKRQYTEELDPSIFLKIWGVLSVDEEARISEGRLNAVTHDNLWNRYYCIISIKPDIRHLPQAESKLHNVLHMVRPHILGHQEFWQLNRVRP